MSILLLLPTFLLSEGFDFNFLSRFAETNFQNHTTRTASGGIRIHLSSSQNLTRNTFLLLSS
ncbi:hypothetical protein BWD14_16240 [Leptospira santarosai]|uniref:Uncharacterized protein n=1 Tax=Leptospira santarosai TaxID=28183 RepID=A0AB73LT60_9LEPT|nr:hypothetical protein BV917_05435 [Leptospira santarosai serovar Guaricura]ONF91685.1 hypothetical protein BWD14_16240 [Leptospira santarosai]